MFMVIAQRRRDVEENMVNFDKILELDNLTLDDCMSLVEQNISIELNNGRITNLVKEIYD